MSGKGWFAGFRKNVATRVEVKAPAPQVTVTLQSGLASEPQLLSAARHDDETPPVLTSTDASSPTAILSSLTIAGQSLAQPTAKHDSGQAAEERREEVAVEADAFLESISSHRTTLAPVLTQQTAHQTSMAAVDSDDGRQKAREHARLRMEQEDAEAAANLKNASKDGYAVHSSGEALHFGITGSLAGQVVSIPDTPRDPAPPSSQSIAGTGTGLALPASGAPTATQRSVAAPGNTPPPDADDSECCASLRNCFRRS